MTWNEQHFLTILEEIVLNHPGGVGEYALYQLLKKRNIKPFSECDLRDDLTLFRIHFMLFHLLYRLKDQLKSQKKGDLEIHCLSIVFIPWKPEIDEKLPELPDAMRSYYLDLKELDRVGKEEVKTMLDTFWQQFSQWQEGGGEGGRKKALALLNLEESTTQSQIKKRYRSLALEHHPDRGGDPEQFRNIREAVDLLLVPLAQVDLMNS